MERYYKRKEKLELSPPSKRDDASSSKDIGLGIESVDPPTNRSVRSRIMDGSPNDREQICRENLQKGPCQLHEYRTCLNASISTIRYLIRQGISFSFNDEDGDSSFQYMFLQFVELIADLNEDVKASISNEGPENLKFKSPDTHKDIVSAAAVETMNAIIRDLGDAPFSIFVGTAFDISTDEQMMTFILRYVDKRGHVIERFLGIEYIVNISALSFKVTLDVFFSRHGLSLFRLRGLSFDANIKLQSEFNGLKTLMIKENESAHYVHCFVHPLEVALVTLAKNHLSICMFFNLVARVVNVIGAPCIGRDIVEEKQTISVIEALNNVKLLGGQRLNQDTSIKPSSDPCLWSSHFLWGSHYDTLIYLIVSFSSVIDVLETIEEKGSNSSHRAEANYLLDLMMSFEFVFNLHLMRTILGITNDLSRVLQRKYHDNRDIENAMSLVQVAKKRLQMMREGGWSSLFNDVSSFCGKHDIVVPNMDDMFRAPGRSRGKAEVTNLHYYLVEVFHVVIDKQFQELHNRFTELNTELLLCIASLIPSRLFCGFDKEKLICLAQFYPKEFSSTKLIELNDELDAYIIDMRSSNEFSQLKGIGDLAQKMVETERDVLYPLVYLLVTLALILPIADATVERVLSAMKIVNNRLRYHAGDQWMNDNLFLSVERVLSAMKIVNNQLRYHAGDQWMNDNLFLFIEQDIYGDIDNEVIMERFEDLKSRRGE